MYTGHFAVALGAAGVARRVPLALLIAAAFASDVVEGVLAGAGLNDPTRVWSHSLPAAVSAGALIGLGWRAFGGTWREAGVLLALATLHSPLDFVTGWKAMFPGLGPMGLQLYTRPYLDAALEMSFCIGGWLVWRRSLPADRASGPPARAMLAVLLLAQAASTVRVLMLGTAADFGLSKFVR
jgi:hypothetical protein